MTDGRYRVVLTGHLMAGFSREAVIAALARLFETSAGSLMGVFDGNDFPVDALLSGEEAGRLHKRIEQIGAKARIEQVVDTAGASDRSLHLPRHDDVIDAGLMTCPACGHRQLVARRCDECGIVFADYNRTRGAGRAASPAPRHAEPAAPARYSPPRSARRSANIHAPDVAGWRDAWVDDGNELPTEQYHLNLFMGQGAATLSAACQRMILGRRTQLMLTWSAGATISPFLWAMYRKMWGWSAVIFVTEVLLPVLLIALGTKDNISDKLTYIGLAGIVANRLFWPFLLKFLYCRHARKAIAYLNRMSPTFAADIDIAAAGGTSRTSAFVGFVAMVVLSLLTWNIVDTIHRVVSNGQPAFVEPPPLADWSPGTPATPSATPPASGQSAATPARPTPPAGIAEDIAVNKWVVTRGRLRTIGQRLYSWMEREGKERNAAQLTMEDIGEVLSIDAETRTDGWGKPIIYRLEDSGFVLASPGPDGSIGSNDDIEYRRSLPR